MEVLCELRNVPLCVSDRIHPSRTTIEWNERPCVPPDPILFPSLLRLLSRSVSVAVVVTVRGRVLDVEL